MLSSPPGAMAKAALLASVILVAPAYAAALFITIDAPPNFVAISDQGPGDLDPADGVIRFDQTLFFRKDGVTEFELKGTVIYVPGTPILGGQTGFGITLTDFSAGIVLDTTGTQFVPRFLLNMEGVFTPGVPAADLGFITDHIDGSITFNANAGLRTFVTDLSTWTGDPPVSAGHAEIPVISLGPGSVVPFSFPDISSPLASGRLDSEIVHYELLLPFCLSHVGGGLPPDCSQFDLPASGVGIVTAIPEAGTGGMLFIGFLAFIAKLRCGDRSFRKAAGRSMSGYFDR